MRTILRVVAAVCLAAPSCQRAPSASVTPTIDPRDELLKQSRAIQRAAWENSFVDATAGAFAPTGFFAGAGYSSQRGADGARKWLGRDSLNLTSRGRWNTVFADVSDDGRDGYTFGYLDVFRASGDSALGTFHAYWRRSDSGRWQILAMARAPRVSGVPTPHTLTPRRRQALAPIDTTVVYAEVARTELAFSDATVDGVAKAFATYADSAAAKSNGAVYVFGRDAIEAFFSSQRPPPGFTGFQWRPEYGTVARSGDLGFTTGPVTRRGAPQAGPGQSGRYFTIWRRQPDGSWRYVID